MTGLLFLGVGTEERATESWPRVIPRLECILFFFSSATAKRACISPASSMRTWLSIKVEGKTPKRIERSVSTTSVCNEIGALKLSLSDFGRIWL